MSTIALIGITIERNVNSSSRKASANTKAKISGRRDTSRSWKSFDCAAEPETFVSAPFTRPTVVGTTCLRIARSAPSEGPSLPLPRVGIETSATVPSRLTVVSVPGRTPGTALASRRRATIPAATGPVRTSAALTATSTVTPSLGNASRRRL